MSRQPESGSVPFRPRARLIKLIGEELISDDVVAVAELVKNAHDADATTVTVFFRGVTRPDGEIEVRDDGCGMDLDALLGRWMQPAASGKAVAGARTTPRGRRVLGEKGVGRFAADKLARRLELVSQAAGSPHEVTVAVDWDTFADDDRMLDELEARWEVRDAPPAHGTRLRMLGPRSVWTGTHVSPAVTPTRPPAVPVPRPRPVLDPHRVGRIPRVFAGELRSDIIDKAPYRIEAVFDGVETVSLTTGSGTSSQRWTGQGELTCGPARIRLFACDLEGEALARIGPRAEVRAWLREWTGVSVYRDGFRVWPYGEPHDDWLRLDQRRVNNPVCHLSNNQIVGFIDITRDGNPQLLDQTNREGLVQNPAVADLRRLVSFVLQALEAERQTVRHPARRGPSHMTPGDGTASGVAELKRLAESADAALRRDLLRLADRMQADRDREEATSRQLVAGYEGLAAVGQIAANLFPDAGELEQVRGDIRAARLAAAGLNGHGANFERLAAASESMAGRLEQFCLTLGSRDDRRRAIDLVAELVAFQKSVAARFRGRDVRLEIEYPEREVLRTEMRPEHFHGMLHVLAANALDWIGREAGQRVRVVLRVEGDRCEIVFSDSGPGIPLARVGQVFEPGYSTKEGGRGMGLTLARRVVVAHGGEIDVIIDGRFRGANLRVSLPRKRSRAAFGGR